MSQELLKKAVQKDLKDNVPDFGIGDTVSVGVRIVEGDKERIQNFVGTVIARRGSGISETFTVRRIVNNEGLERVFPIHSPSVTEIKVLRQGRVRRAKLYYLRGRLGKATRIKEATSGPKVRDKKAARQPPAKTSAPQEPPAKQQPQAEQQPPAEQQQDEAEQQPPRQETSQEQ